MIQKVSLYVMAVLLFSPFFFTSSTSPVHAEESNVIDWLNEEEPTDQSVDKGEENVEPGNTKEKSFISIIGQLILYTLFILLLIYGLIKFLSLRQKKLQPNQAVQLMGGTSLGNNKSLQLVKVGNKVYLLGVADQVTLIKEFTSEEEINLIEQDLDKRQSLFSPTNFSLLRGKKSKQPGANDFEQLFQQSLDKQKVKQNQLEQEFMKENDEQEGRQR